MKSKLIKSFLGWSLLVQIATIVAIISFIFFTPFFSGNFIYAFITNSQDGIPQLFVNKISKQYFEDTGDLRIIIQFGNMGEKPARLLMLQYQDVGIKDIYTQELDHLIIQNHLVERDIMTFHGNSVSQPHNILFRMIYDDHSFFTKKSCIEYYFYYDGNVSNNIQVMNSSICRV